ncbi:MAG: FtsW/RodA/SpoVE family cell cycle protein [Lachnospiraceae bacterium]|nr:FtsW/RodA/SpoVE family cell cycle protein [Lachnospiraceae bacterium]
MFKIWERYDLKKYRWSILLMIILLCTAGIYVLGKVQGEEELDMVSRQIKGLIGGICLAVFVSLFDYHFVCKFAGLMYLVNFGLLFVVKYVDYFNIMRGGVNRWIGIPNGEHPVFEFQVSELTKVVLVICLATLFDRLMDRLKQGWVLLLAVIMLALPIGLVFMQPDLSTTIVICVSMVVVIFASGIKYKILLPIAATAFPVAIGLFWYVQQDFQVLLSGKQQERILSVLHPESHSATLWQQENSITAIASGGLTGKIFSGDGTLGAKNIPVIESDFIFSGMAEAFGFLGSCAIVIIILLISFQCFLIARKAPDYLGRLLALGIGTTYIFQAFVNIGVVTMLLPNTGIPLPFVSYGLSSLLCNMIGIGIILNIGISKKKEKSQIDLDFSMIPRKGDL